MRSRRTRFWSLTAAVLLVGAAACTSSTTSSSKPPILIGASLSLTGDFSADGQAFKQGYELWASDVNSHGGLLGRPVKLIILNDGSNPTTVVSDYQKLISADHVNLTFGPFSSLLTQPAASIAARYHYALVMGAGATDNVFQLVSNKHVHNVFSPTLPAKYYLVPFVKWIESLPRGQRPATAAYPMVSDPFADPLVQVAQAQLRAAGVKTVYSRVVPAEASADKGPADQVATLHPQLVVLGSPDIPTVAAFMRAFEQQHYVPKMFIATSGPDGGTAFLNAVGAGNATGMMVPNGWYGEYANPLSHAMVHDYVAKYGGNASTINTDVAEAYSVGEVAAYAVTATHGTDNGKIIEYLHSGVTLNTVQGPAKFDALGENPLHTSFIFQWQNGHYNQVIPVGQPGTVKILFPKPNWFS